LDIAALRAAIADLVTRHEILRTVYPQHDSGPVQVILPPNRAIPRLDTARPDPALPDRRRRARHDPALARRHRAPR
ncbi:hypothetical protein, partial [Nocardia cyriacigeorgica]|uniref:hypothetical protein n=1 Tax=Nocardia cyriacigeorgica TaxID=135487 RepID=UPI0024559703